MVSSPRQVVVGWGLTLIWAWVAVAQDADPGQLAADRFRQLAGQVADLARDDQPGDLALVTRILDQASTFAPGDAELWRLRMELDAAQMGQGPSRELQAGYLRAAPDDDAAKLSFLMALVTEHQTAPARAEALERMLADKRSAGLTDAMRSRLAWSAAALRRDQGEAESYRKLLKSALSLDPSNAAAAEGAYALLAADESTSELDRARALLVWHAAAPTDHRTHLLVARTLLRCGRYESAAKWFDSADLLAAEQGGLPNDQALALVADWARALWGTGQGAGAVKLIQSVPIRTEDQQLPEPLRELLGEIEAAGENRPEPVTPFEGSAAVARSIEAIPDDLRRIATSATRFLSLKLTLPTAPLRYAEPLRVTVQLTNLTQLPLGVGSDGIVPTTLFLWPTVKVGGDKWRLLSPQPVEMGRTLVLEPGASITVQTILDGPDLARALDEQPEEPVQVSVKALLNPLAGPEGKWTTGLMGVEVVGRRIERQAVQATDEAIAAAAARAAGDGADAMFAAAWLTRVVGTLPADRTDSSVRAATAVNEFWSRADAPRRAWIAGHFVPGDATRQRLSRTVADALNSGPPAVQYATILTMADRTDAPELTALLRSGADTPGRAFAEAYRSLLQASAKPAAPEPTK